jgi:hypothetical protein
VLRYLSAFCSRRVSWNFIILKAMPLVCVFTSVSSYLSTVSSAFYKFFAWSEWNECIMRRLYHQSVSWFILASTQWSLMNWA